MGVSFSLARPKAKNSSIRVKIATQGANFFVYTGKTISPELWDFKKSFIKSQVGNPTAAKATKYLRKIQMDLTEVYDDYRFGISKMTFLELQAKVHEVVGNPRAKLIIQNRALAMPSKSLIDFIDHFISDCETGVRLSPKRQKLKPSSINSYKTTRGCLLRFQEQFNKVLTLKDFSQSDIDMFSDFLIIDEEYAMNTHSKTQMDLLQIIKYAIKLKLIPASKIFELEFDTRREITDHIYLTEEEIIQMSEIKNFDDPLHEQVRDLFVLSCFTAQRYSDISTFNANAIINNRLEFIQKKTDVKVVIPIHPIVSIILKKYNNNLPKMPINNEFNRVIKIVAEKIPSLHAPFTKQITYGRELKKIVSKRWELTTHHSSRRSFCSNELIKGTDPTVIMAISGHKSYKSFMRYIKVSNEQFANKLEGIWNERYAENSK